MQSTALLVPLSGKVLHYFEDTGLGSYYLGRAYRMGRKFVSKPSIIGAGEVDHASSVDMDKDSVYKTNSFCWDTQGNDFLGAIVLPNYGAFVSEKKCQLFGDASGKSWSHPKTLSEPTGRWDSGVLAIFMCCNLKWIPNALES